VKIIGVVALVICSFVSSWAASNSANPVQRDSTVSVTIHFDSAVEQGRAFLLWQTYDDSAAKLQRDKGMVLTFTCSAPFEQSSGPITIQCKIPLDAADGHYYLTSVSVGDLQHQRTFSWRGELPSDLVMVVKGGPTNALPKIKTIQIAGTNDSAK